MSERNQPPDDPLRPVFQEIIHEVDQLVARAVAPLVERVDRLEREVAELQDEQRKSKTAGSEATDHQRR